MKTDINILTEAFKKFGICLNERQIQQFVDYYEILVTENEKMNLTAITDWKEVVFKHFVDSSSIINLFNDYDELSEFFKGKSIADIGTGAGFPGVVLKILLPDLKVTLMDSLEKRVGFLNRVIDKLQLTGITTIHGRVEDLAKEEIHREKYDFSTARAVAALPVLCEYCVPFVKKDGSFFAYKSEKADEEILLCENAFKELKCNVANKKSFCIDENEMHRTIIEIRKSGNTPIKYPRKAGTPTKKPL